MTIINRLPIILLLLLVYAAAQAKEQAEDVTFSDDLVDLAQSGDVDAQYELAECYYEGYGIDQDFEEAYYWFAKAANQGDADAQYSLGWMCIKGEYVDKDIEKAVEWYTLAGEQGQDLAQYELGELYYHGEEVKEDFAAAVKWYQKAAEQDNADAQFSLGYCFQYGQGVDEDLAAAKEWYTKAAAQEQEDAINELKKINDGERQKRVGHSSSSSQSALGKLVGHSYYCKDVNVNGGCTAVTGGMKLEQTVTFTSTGQARMKTQVSLPSAGTYRNASAHDVKSRVEKHFNGSTKVSYVGGYILLGDVNGPCKGGFKPQGDNKIVDLNGNVFHKVN